MDIKLTHVKSIKDNKVYSEEKDVKLEKLTIKTEKSRLQEHDGVELNKKESVEMEIQNMEEYLPIYQDILKGVEINIDKLNEEIEKLEEIFQREYKTFKDIFGDIEPTNRDEITRILDVDYYNFRRKHNAKSYRKVVLKDMAENGIEFANVILKWNEVKYKLDRLYNIRDTYVDGKVYPSISTAISRRKAFSEPPLSNTPMELLVKVLGGRNLYEIDMKQADPKCVYALTGLQYLRDKVINDEDIYNAIIEDTKVDIPRGDCKTVWNATVYGGGSRTISEVNPNAMGIFKKLNKLEEIKSFRDKIERRIKRGRYYFSTITGEVVDIGKKVSVGTVINYSMQTSSSIVFEEICKNLYKSKLKDKVTVVLTIYDSILVILDDESDEFIKQLKEDLEKDLVYNEIPFSVEINKLR